MRLTGVNQFPVHNVEQLLNKQILLILGRSINSCYIQQFKQIKLHYNRTKLFSQNIDINYTEAEN